MASCSTNFSSTDQTGNLAPRERQDKFTVLLEKVLNNENIDLSALIAREINRQPAYFGLRRRAPGEQIYFDNGGFRHAHAH